MSDIPVPDDQPPTAGPAGPVRRMVEAVGASWLLLVSSASALVRFFGGATYLLRDALVWTLKGLFVPRVRFGRHALAAQMVRVGVRSIPIIVLVQVFIGIILALQLAPTLEAYGQLERVADVVAIAIFRELGPLISAIVLSGYAGASIAAELGTMVEAEEIKALRAHALNPIQFLVVPRMWATVVMLVGLCVIADVVGTLGGLLTSWFVLDIGPVVYIEYTRAAIDLMDLSTGLIKAGVFGLLISLIACYEGLTVAGGAEGVGRATTATVVKSIVALIGTDVLFTSAFYAMGL
jgi:phospholipid/cholesterol/gamma-HCH transport system permease protein